MKITKKEIAKNTQVTSLSFDNFQYRVEIGGVHFEARNDNQIINVNDRELSIELAKRENYLEVGSKKDFTDAVYKITNNLI